MAEEQSAAGLIRRGNHFLVRDGQPIVPVGAHIVPAEGPDWPWRTGAEAFDRVFAQMARLGLNTARFDVLWAAVEPEPGRYDEEHLRVAPRDARLGRQRQQPSGTLPR